MVADAAGRPSGYSYAREIAELDGLLQPFLHPDFFFVNIGANDGVLNDPVFPFLDRYRWHGIAVEPVPHLFERLRRTAGRFEGVVLENAAIAASPRPFWQIDQHTGSREFLVQQLGGLDRDHVLDAIAQLRAHPSVLPADASVLTDASAALVEPIARADAGEAVVDGLEVHVRRVDVECLTFDELMRRHDASNVDFVSISASGCDGEVLSTIDLARYRPSAVRIELERLPPAQKLDVQEELARHGYRPGMRFALLSVIFVADGHASRRSGASRRDVSAP